MKKIFLILSLLVLCLMDTHPVNAAGDFSKITWTNSLKTAAEVTAYLASKHGMAAEVLSLSADSPPVVKMGPDAAGALTMDTCLKLFKDGRHNKQLFLDVPNVSIYKAAVELLKDENNGGAMEWVYLNMRVVKGPNGGPPGITQKEILDVNEEGIRKSIGVTIGEGPKKGYKSDMFQSIINGWDCWDLPTEMDLALFIDIFHISYTDSKTLEKLEEVLEDPIRVYYLSKDKQDVVRMQAFRRHIGDNLGRSYLNAPEKFLTRFFAKDTSEPTDPPDNIMTTPAGGGIVAPMGMVIGGLAIAVML